MPLSREAGVRQRGGRGGVGEGADAVCKSTSINMMACSEGTAAPVAGTAVWASIGRAGKAPAASWGVPGHLSDAGGTQGAGLALTGLAVVPLVK